MSFQPLPAGWVHGYATTRGVRLHYVEAGRGEPAVLLHGFPECWYAWRHQLPALAAAGFRTIAPDLRGYNESDKPRGVSAYRGRRLIEDVVGLIDACGGRACVVGHDWGGVIAWRLAQLHPEQVRRLVIINAPHPAAFRDTLRHDPRQWLRSAYIAFFQLPGLPEWLIRRNNFALPERTWRREPSRRGAYTGADIAAYKRALAKPYGLTGPLNYYRAAMRYPRDWSGPPQAVTMPTLVLWGENDPYLGVSLTERLERWVPGVCVERWPGVSHWVPNDEPDGVNRAIVEFFGH